MMEKDLTPLRIMLDLDCNPYGKEPADWEVSFKSAALSVMEQKSHLRCRYEITTEQEESAMTNPITILLVDDHEIVRQGVRGFFDTHDEFDVVGEAENGKQAVNLAEELIPDVVLMDLIMGAMDGVEATRQVKNISPRSQIVVLTSYHEDEHIFPALQAGALSYILKDVKMEELAEAVRKAARGEATLHSRVASRVIQELHGSKRDDDRLYTQLTSREMEILKLIADGFNNHQLSEHLVISEHTVKGHVSNILSKLHLVDRTQAAVYAWKKGVVRRE
jgi:NarL family two-component system response regulator LiaR